MTTELILLLGLYSTILLGAFAGPRGPLGVFKESGPRLGAKIERSISIGHGFTRNTQSQQIDWSDDGTQ